LYFLVIDAAVTAVATEVRAQQKKKNEGKKAKSHRTLHLRGFVPALSCT
jgi:hypothetical protein